MGLFSGVKNWLGGASRKLFGDKGSGHTYWDDIDTYEDPTTGITYQAEGRRKRGGTFGHGSYKNLNESRLKATGLEGESVFDTGGSGKKLYHGSGAGKIMRHKSGVGDAWVVRPWLKRIKAKQSERWQPTNVEKFDLKDPESVKKWIRKQTGQEGKRGVDWFRQQARDLKEGMRGASLEQLVKEEGDVIGLAEKKKGAGVREFVQTAQSLAESLGDVGGNYDAQRHGGQFLKWLTTGQGPQTLLGQLEGRLESHEANVAEKRKRMLKAGERAGAGYRGQIEEAKEGEHRTGRQEAAVAGLLEDMLEESKTRRSMFQEDVMGSWATELGDPLKDLAGGWLEVEDTSGM
tara:strand:+ start:270 stop:1310 length:1041 start_codon:yes stop_codon:yes gene_type:complete